MAKPRKGDIGAFGLGLTIALIIGEYLLDRNNPKDKALAELDEKLKTPGYTDNALNHLLYEVDPNPDE